MSGMHFLSLPTGNVLLEAVTMMLIGAFVLPITSISYAFSVELAFPVPEVMTNGMMISLSLIWGTFIGFLCQTLGDINPLYTLGVWTICSICAFILSLFIEEDLRRLQMDDVKHSEYIEDDEFRKQSFE